MLAAALQAEVAAYIEAHAGEVDEYGRRLVVRNGYHLPREVTTAAGAVPVRAPRINDKRIDEATGERQRFSSAILPAWTRHQTARRQQALGHASLKTTSLYVQLAREDMDRQLQEHAL